MNITQRTHTVTPSGEATMAQDDVRQTALLQSLWIASLLSGQPVHGPLPQLAPASSWLPGRSALPPPVMGSLRDGQEHQPLIHGVLREHPLTSQQLAPQTDVEGEVE